MTRLDVLLIRRSPKRHYSPPVPLDHKEFLSRSFHPDVLSLTGQTQGVTRPAEGPTAHLVSLCLRRGKYSLPNSNFSLKSREASLKETRVSVERWAEKLVTDFGEF